MGWHKNIVKHLSYHQVAMLLWWRTCAKGHIFTGWTRFNATKGLTRKDVISVDHRFPNWGTQSGSGGTRGEIRGMYPLKQNCNFQTETSFCASKSPKCPCILPCKAVFLSNKHNNDRNDEQALIKKQNHWENVTSVLNSAPATPPCSTWHTHLRYSL